MTAIECMNSTQWVVLIHSTQMQGNTFMKHRWGPNIAYVYGGASHVSLVNGASLKAPCGLRGCKNRPAPFPGRMSYKITKSGLVSVLYLSIRYTVLLFIEPLLCIVSFRCYMFCLLFVLVKYLPSDWLERLLWGSLIVARPRGDRLQKAQAEECVSGLLYCFIVLSCICLLSLRDYNYFPTFMARYGLFMLKVPLNPKQASKQTNVTEKAVVCKMLLKTVWHTWLSRLLFFVHRHLLHFHRTEQTATRIKLTDPIKVFRTWQWRREGGGARESGRPERQFAGDGGIWEANIWKFWRLHCSVLA